ncbi:MAG: TonB-dependent siderophore receptor, partial [Burkholderiales bacterium]|nr:TonB-dependent siderophore receptor [Burkholderiales bacterium]
MHSRFSSATAPSEHPSFTLINSPLALVNKGLHATQLIAFLALTPVALGVAQAVQAQSLPTVTVKASADDGYSPASSSTATKGNAPLRDIPQSVNVVPGQLLKDQAAHSMQDALRNVPGVAFSSGDGQRDQVIIRGFTAISDQFIDGVRDDALYFRDLSNIERVEVLKGPSAVLYGRGSSGGLINRVTKKPKLGETSGEAALSVGSFDLKRVEGDFNIAAGESAAFRLSLAREDSGSYRDQQFLDRYSVAPSLVLKLTNQTDLLLQYTKARDQRLTDFGIPALNGRPVDVPASTYYGSGTARKDDTTTSLVDSFTATVNHRFNDVLSVRNTTRYSSYELDRYNSLPSGTTDPVALTVGRTRSFILRDELGWFNQTDFTYKSSAGGFPQEWLFGLELGQQARRSESVSGGTVDRVSILTPGRVPVPAIPAASYLTDSAIPSHTQQDVLGIYLQDRVTLAKDWKALIGGRFDQFKQATSFDRKLSGLERTDTSFSPRAGLVWQPAESQSYYLSYSRSFQPSAEAFALAANNAANAPEFTRNIEVGSKLDFLDGALAVTAAVFNLERSDIKNTDPAKPAQQINVGTQRTNGLELTANGRLPGNWDISAGYAFLDGQMTQSVASITSTQLPLVSVPSLGKTPALTPRHSAFVWGMKDLGKGFSLGGGLNYVGERFTSLTNLVTLPSYLTADLAAAYKTGRYETSVNIKNVTDQKYIVSSHGSNDNLIVPGAPHQV